MQLESSHGEMCCYSFISDPPKRIQLLPAAGDIPSSTPITCISDANPPATVFIFSCYSWCGSRWTCRWSWGEQARGLRKAQLFVHQGYCFKVGCKATNKLGTTPIRQATYHVSGETSQIARRDGFEFLEPFQLRFLLQLDSQLDFHSRFDLASICTFRPKTHRPLGPWTSPNAGWSPTPNLLRRFWSKLGGNSSEALWLGYRGQQSSEFTAC